MNEHKKKSQVYLSYREYEFIKLCGLFGYIDVDTIEDIAYGDVSDRYTRRRIKLLIDNGYLIKEMRGPIEGYDTPDKYRLFLYRLGVNGVKAYNSMTGDRLKFEEYDFANPQVSHQIMVVRVVLTLFKQLMSSGYEIVDVYSDNIDFKEETFVMPDATIIFKNSKTDMQGSLFIEIERHYVTQYALNNKLSRYYNGFKHNRFDNVVKTDLADARIIYITTTDNKYRNLLDKLNTYQEESLHVLLGQYIEVVNQEKDIHFLEPGTQRKFRAIDPIMERENNTNE